MWEYAEYTARVRKYARELPVEDAVENAIVECIEEGILEDFLRKNRAEAKNMSIYEYNQEKHLRQEREASWEEGREAGIREGRESGISESRRQTAINLSKMGMDVEKQANRNNRSISREMSCIACFFKLLEYTAGSQSRSCVLFQVWFLRQRSRR